ncbi:trypsin-like serine peptidase [Vibrio sagamiensis]|uniref:Trypsin protease n=1 Tax=Vibrio sagamiensis NBRC 104589 TaxID=1219064 RepID=A0A511QAZ0_9VIBR|nr:trypsin-like serine protease [Vibrio sagamiensis]PNQ63036.1 hypothetical protein C1141_10335 [Vibrio agarivorans]GEM74406.1 trypsin protease precursor [Vibrio sagamiensis NBRC 104589]
MVSLVIYPIHAWAIINGESIVWAENDNTVSLINCTGTRIGRHYVLTAAHCFDDEQERYYLADAHHQYERAIVDKVVIHPNYSPLHPLSEDVAILTLSEITDVARIQFFKDLTLPTYIKGTRISVDGFGGKRIPERARFKLTTMDEKYPFNIEAEKVGIAHTESGDSGAAWINQDNEIIAVHQAIGVHTIAGTDLYFASDFILDNINGWHYPTIATVSEHTTIEVQSLHRNVISDSAYVRGDVVLNVDESTCLKGPIKPFERCTYVIENTGGSGELYLSRTEVIRLTKGDDVNNSSGNNTNDIKPKPLPITNNPDAEQVHGKSGGSIGLASLLLMLGLSLIRKRFST